MNLQHLQLILLHIDDPSFVAQMRRNPSCMMSNISVLLQNKTKQNKFGGFLLRTETSLDC